MAPSTDQVRDHLRTHRTPLDRRVLAMVLAMAFASVPPAAFGGYRDDMHATSIEVALLPQFCWRQFDVPNTEGDEFRIRDCGPSANHYCPGYLYLIRGKHASKKHDALQIFSARRHRCTLHGGFDYRLSELFDPRTRRRDSAGDQSPAAPLRRQACGLKVTPADGTARR